MRVSARAIIISEKQLLIFRRRKLDIRTGRMIEYYSLPGGGVEEGESLEDAVVRELQEEMSIKIRIIQKVAVIEKNNRQHHMYWASIIDGRPRLNSASEEYRMQNRFNSYEVQWVDIDSLELDMFRWGFEHVVPIIKNISLGINIHEAQFFRDE